MKTNISEIPDHLCKVDLEAFEVERKKRGKGFCFVYRHNNNLVKEKSRLKILESIGVPNTWTNVRMCLNPQAYIQASGNDGSGKLQYLYHPDYLQYRNERKFEGLYEFGRVLPRIRRRIKRDLRQEEWNEDKLMALMVRILDKYHLRIGSRIYAKTNKSFGLTTLRKKHLRERDTDLSFEYIGKSGQQRKIPLTDPSVVSLIREISEFPGWELFSVKNGDHRIKATSDAINEYIRKISGADFTARSFRTWAGTVLAVKNHSRAKEIVEQNPRREFPAVLTELVAVSLGNTPAICRSYYIHPGVFEKVVGGDFNPQPCDSTYLKNNLYRRHECRTMEILKTFRV